MPRILTGLNNLIQYIKKIIHSIIQAMRSKDDLVEKIDILERRVTEYEVETTKMTSSNMRMMMKVNRLESDVVDKEEANEVLKNNLEELLSKHELLRTNNEKLETGGWMTE